MTAAVLVAIVAPLVAAAFAVTPAARGARRSVHAVAAIALALAGAAAVTLLVAAVRGEPVARFGFVADPWKAGLAVGALLVCATALARRDPHPIAVGVFLAGTSAAVAACLAGHTFGAAGSILATAAAFGVLAICTGSRAAARASVLYVAATTAAAAGLVLVSGEGVQAPPAVAGIGAVLLASAAGVFAGVVPGQAWFDDVVRDDPMLAAFALGPMRAFAFLLVGWVALERSAVADAVVVIAALLGAWAAYTAARASVAGRAQAALTALALAGLAMGATTTVRGAVLLVAGTFLGAALLLLGRDTDVGAPTIGAAPLGATLPGAVLVVSSLFDRGLGERWVLGAAVFAVATLAWLAVAGVAGVVRAGAPVARVHVAWSFLPLLAATAIALVPATALEAVGVPAGEALGARPPLGPLSGAVPNDVGIAFGVAGLVALVLARGQRPPLARPEPDAGTIAVDPLPRTLVVAAGIGVVALGWLVALLWVGMGRGFL